MHLSVFFGEDLIEEDPVFLPPDEDGNWEFGFVPSGFNGFNPVGVWHVTATCTDAETDQVLVDYEPATLFVDAGQQFVHGRFGSRGRFGSGMSVASVVPGGPAGQSARPPRMLFGDSSASPGATYLLVNYRKNNGHAPGCCRLSALRWVAPSTAS
jgi:hypothetical protein